MVHPPQFDDSESPALEKHERIFTPAYWGPYGWLGYDLCPANVDWAEVCELIEDSFRNTASKKLIAELEATR